MSTQKSTLNEIVSALEHFSNQDRTDKMKTYAPTAMKVLGASSPDIRLVVKESNAALKELSNEELIALASGLVGTDIFECQHTAWLILEKRKGLIPSLTIKQMESVRGLLDNWASVDGFGVIIFGALWKTGTVTDDMVMELTRSRDVWYRRLSLVATVYMNLRSRGAVGDAGRTLMVCRALADDHHDMIEKALSWALRTLVYWDADAVESFILKYENVLGKRVKREVLHKLRHGSKN